MTKKILDAWADAWDEVNAEREKSGTMRIQSFSEAEQYIRVKDVRYTLDEFNRIGNFLLGRELADDQQEVLEWLQIYADKDSGDKPFQTIFFLWDCIKSNNLGNVELSALRKLTRAEQFQVLAAFAEWGSKGEER